MPANNTHYRDIRVDGMPRLLTHMVIVAHMDAEKGDRLAMVWLRTMGRRWLEVLGASEVLVDEYVMVASVAPLHDVQHRVRARPRRN